MASPVFVADEVVTAAKMNLITSELLDAPGGDTEPNSRTFTNTAYLDLDALTGGTGSITAVSATVETRTRVFVAFSAELNHSAAGGWTAVSYRISGATTVAADDAWSARHVSTTANFFGTGSRSRIHTGLTAGTNTIEVVARSGGGGTSQISRIDLTVIPL